MSGELQRSAVESLQRRGLWADYLGPPTQEMEGEREDKEQGQHHDTSKQPPYRTALHLLLRVLVGDSESLWHAAYQVP